MVEDEKTSATQRLLVVPTFKGLFPISSTTLQHVFSEDRDHFIYFIPHILNIYGLSGVKRKGGIYREKKWHVCN